MASPASAPATTAPASRTSTRSAASPMSTSWSGCACVPAIRGSVRPAYRGDKDFPVIMFLHGSGSKGTDGKKQMGGGLAKAIRANEKDFAFMAVFPQAEQTWNASSPDGARAVAILDEVLKEYRTD